MKKLSFASAFGAIHLALAHLFAAHSAAAVMAAAVGEDLVDNEIKVLDNSVIQDVSTKTGLPASQVSQLSDMAAGLIASGANTEIEKIFGAEPVADPVQTSAPAVVSTLSDDPAIQAQVQSEDPAQ